MELKENKNVFFEPVSHSYTNADGKLLMGLTSLMHKHGLGADYKNIPDAILKKAAEKGTAVHEYLQEYDEGGLVPTSDLLDDYKKLNLHHVASEYLVSDNELVATSIDKVYEVGKNLVDLADIKTTQKVHRRALQWQLGVGKALFEAQNPGIKVRSCFCLWADKEFLKLKEVIPIEPVSQEEVDALLDCEKNGLIYIDEHNVPEASLVLTDNEIAEYVGSAAKVAELKDTIKQIEEVLKGYDKKMLDYMTENNITEMAAPAGVFKMKAAYSQTRVDSAKLQKLYPAVYEKVVKTTNISASLSFKPIKTNEC